jgi:predicted AlkP superfamily pyrophosphatase or phosphodiesterase
VSFSALDRTYHLYGPTSWEVQDHLLRLDRALGDLIAAAERAAGRGNVLVILSSDHGGANIPEEWAALGLPATRVSPAAIQKGLNEELEKRFGAPGLVTAIEEVDVYLDQKAIEAKKLDGGALRRAVATSLMRNADVQVAVAREDVEQLGSVAGLGNALRHAFHPERSGDVLFVLKPFRVLDSEPLGTSHGTPWSYDSEIPVLLMGRGVRPGVYPGPAKAIDVAPTAALLMELGAPAMAEGVPLSDALLLSR